MSRRRVVSATVAIIAVMGAIIGISVVWPGLDAKRTSPVDTSVWAIQTGEGRRYARVNTAIGELDTVRRLSNPSAVTQAGAAAYLFSESFGKVTQIDESMPADLDEDALRDSPSTPTGTVEAAVAGDYVAYRTDSGAIFAGSLSRGDTTQLDPYGAGDQGGNIPEYTAEAIAVDDSGLLYSYSSVDGAVLRYRISTGQVEGRDALPAAPKSDTLDITAANGTWFLVDLAKSVVWRRGDDASRPINTVGTVVTGRSVASGDSAYLADEVGLLRLPTDGSAFERVVGGEALDFGDPARPVVFQGQVYGAWLRQDGGVLWRPGAGVITLDYGGSQLPEERRPAFVQSGSALILNETRSGWVWTAPDGKLVPSSQDWSLDDRTNAASEPSDEQAKVVTDPKPPVAEPDSFGVRAGSLATLPVLMNDHDPNEDVLSIDPQSVTGLDPGFGTVTITDSGQRLAVQAAPGATGTATLHYRVTDGTSSDGLYSEPTTVTLTVASESANTAPQWCGVANCLVEWPQPQVAPGGTVSVPVLPGWVDPEGDPLLLLSVVNQSGIGAVASTPSGDVVYQHPSSSETSARVIELLVTVSDTRGATTTKPLLIRVSPTPQPTAQSFNVVDTQSGGLTVDVAPHVTGTAGRLALSAVRVLDDAPAEAVATAGSTSFDFTASKPGTYRVSYTVTDGDDDATATARITILPDDAPAQLATAPVIAFVHPKEDVTIDVFAAVSNPTRRVLLLSDVKPDIQNGASLSVDVVGQNFMRVAGTTATGAPGKLGTVRYVVSDGTEDAGARVEGEATVYLLPNAPELAPIAVDDTVVVRAGAQIDIPVLDNDVAPSGSAITLNPASVTSDTNDALAFASGNVLRYLAPSKPGDYRVDYSIFSSGAPSLADQATVRVTVIDNESNRAPRPETLEGRVLSGQVTTVPFDQFGVDPDGDAVALDRIMSQPKSSSPGQPSAASGSAAISADGESIVYTSVPGFSGQVSFTYRVVDGRGATGVGTVRIGVLDGQSNPSPVTFTDYVQVQVGENSSVRVSPLANDIDPTGGVLTISDVTPDVVETLDDGTPNPEYARQEALLETVTGTVVQIDAGTEPGTMSYLYDVASDSGNTGRGLIVVKVVRESVPDYPIVSDTLLTAETRANFRTGIDVVSGKVAWTGGDVNGLVLTLWGAPRGVSVDGWMLSGELPTTSRVIPFALTGKNSSGDEVTSYGFLRIPGERDVTLALRSGVSAQQVTERQSVTFDMRQLVSVPQGMTLEVGSDVAPSGARSAAACALAGGTQVRYDAGDGAPWADACTVPVRIAGQDGWTYLSVPIRVRAIDPVPVLRASSLTVGPGQTTDFDLSAMTSWQGRVDPAGITYSVDYTGTEFSIVANGSILTITGDDRAAAGTEEVAMIGVTSHSGVAPARLILRVGALPSTLPQGGTVAKQCSQASGTSCEITVVGAPGEVNPLARTPLQLVAVKATGACVGVTFTVASTSTALATWTADAPGATCTATFSLKDAQGRVTNADRNGSLLLDLQGYPGAPAAISQSAYADTRVTLSVDPGAARQAYPAITGFVVRRGDEVVATCTPDGVCPSLSAPNGEERVYTAVAVNAVGDSRTSVSTSAWAYDPPPAPSAVTASAIVTGGDGGLIALRIDGVDTTETGFLEIASAAGEKLQVAVRAGDTTVYVPRYRIGTNTLSAVTVTPFSKFEVPPGLAGSTSGSTVTAYANGIGAPQSPALALSSASNGDGTATITAQGSATLNGDGSQLRFGFVRSGSTCTASSPATSATFPSLPDGEVYDIDMCVESVRDGVSYGRATATQSVRAVQSAQAPQGYTFAVDPRPIIDANHLGAAWIIRDTPTSAEVPPRNNVAVFTGGPPTSVFGRDPGIQVYYQHQIWGTTSKSATVTPRAGSAPYQLWARWSVQTCEGGSALVTSRRSADPGAAITFTLDGATFYDADGAVLDFDPSTGIVPIGATRFDGVGVTVDWSAQGWGLNPATTTFGGTCSPGVQP